MGYICLNCYNEFNKETLKLDQCIEGYRYRCPMSSCGDINMVEIDDLLIPIIKELNKKGYETTYCCSGHTCEDNTNTYISFELDTVPEVIPNGFILEDEEYYIKNNWTWIGNQMCIRKWYKEVMSENELHIEILKTMINLAEWVDKLGYIN